VRTVLVAALLVVALPGALRAEIVRWTDERGITHYSEGLDTVPERYRAGAEPLGIRNRPTVPGADRPVIRPEGEIIRFTPGRHIHIDVRINDSVSARLILDTGAGQTMISPHVLAAAGVPFGQGRAVRGRGIADGVYVDAIRVPVQSLTVGNARVERMAVAAYDMGWRDVEGLLGQDFLGQFNVSIDPTLGIVTLKPR
jgi:hypothetical protein